MDLLTEPTPQTPSLAERVFARLRRSGGDFPAGGGWRFGVALAVLLAAGPVATLVGARIAENRALAAGAALTRTAAPRLEEARAHMAARDTLAPLLSRPTLGATLEGLARALPPENSLVRAERGEDGRLSIDVASPDPDPLRAALRREPVTQGLRDAGQRGGDGAMVVTFEGGS
jgi:hypothetical protein